MDRSPRSFLAYKICKFLVLCCPQIGIAAYYWISPVVGTILMIIELFGMLGAADFLANRLPIEYNIRWFVAAFVLSVSAIGLFILFVGYSNIELLNESSAVFVRPFLPFALMFNLVLFGGICLFAWDELGARK